MAQQGKCKISGEILKVGEMHCHHIKTRKNNGTDKYDNLIFVTDKIHKLIHATNNQTMTQYLTELNLNKKQLEKLNEFRKLIQNIEIQK